MGDGYLSRDKQHLAALRRARRAGVVRIDYMPSAAALAIFDAYKATQRPGSREAANSAVLDAILIGWAELTGINCGEVGTPMSPELAGKYAQARMSPVVDRSARAQESGFPLAYRARVNESGGQTGITAGIAGARVGAYESGKATLRVQCGAKRHRDGQPCQAKSEPGKRRCRFHGGRSTGPKTPEGKARALANLRQYREPPEA